MKINKLHTQRWMGLTHALESFLTEHREVYGRSSLRVRVYISWKNLCRWIYSLIHTRNTKLNVLLFLSPPVERIYILKAYSAQDNVISSAALRRNEYKLFAT